MSANNVKFWLYCGEVVSDRDHSARFQLPQLISFEAHNVLAVLAVQAALDIVSDHPSALVENNNIR